MSLGVIVLGGNGPRGGSCPGCNCPRGSCPMGVMVLWGSCPWGSCPQGSSPRDSCPRGSCPVTPTSSGGTRNTVSFPGKGNQVGHYKEPQPG